MNQGTDMLFIQSLAFLEKKITVFRKNLKVDNYLYCIKPRQNKELKYRRKNLVCVETCRNNLENPKYVLQIKKGFETKL